MDKMDYQILAQAQMEKAWGELRALKAFYDDSKFRKEYCKSEDTRWYKVDKFIESFIKNFEGEFL